VKKQVLVGGGSEVASPDEKQVIAFSSPSKFEIWIKKNHSKSLGIWLQLFKVASGHPSVSYAEALDVALCYGWIDGPIRKGNEVSWLVKFTPRGKRSVWSQKNKKNIERLIAEGRMTAAGLVSVELAKQHGRWDAAYASSSTCVESEEFLRYAFYYRLHNLKKPESRARKISEFVAMLERGETF
jgi:uncharacterized protein YdeI (YjbR/CyaY-like superfamily)